MQRSLTIIYDGGLILYEYFKSVISPEIGRVCIKFGLHPENIFPNNTTKRRCRKILSRYTYTLHIIGSALSKRCTKGP